MGLLNRFVRRKSEVVSFKEAFGAKAKEVSEALNITLEKAKKYGGDPFYEHRKKKILPENFEYGMNCLLDRIFEVEGEKVAQKTYDELKKMGGCILEEDTSSVDVAGLPILLSVKGIKTGVDAHNKAVSIIQEDEKQTLSDKFREKLLTDNPIFLQKLENETKFEYTWRLSGISMGLTDLSIKFNKQGKYLESIRVEVYKRLIDDILLSSEEIDNREISDLETDKLLFMGNVIREILPNEEAELYEFLSDMGPRFWNKLMEGVLRIFNKKYPEEFIQELLLPCSYSFVKGESFSIAEWKIAEWKKNPDLKKSGMLNIIWKEVENKIIEFEKKSPEEPPFRRDVFLITVTAIIMIIADYEDYENNEDKFQKIISTADSSILRFLFDKIAEESIKDYKGTKM